MAKNRGPHSSRPRKNPRYNRTAKAQHSRREKEKQRRSNEKTDSYAIFLDQEPIERTHSKAVKDLKAFSETFVPDKISQHFKISSACSPRGISNRKWIFPRRREVQCHERSVHVKGKIRLLQKNSIWNS
ncbi:hypothetical protein AVEN_219135-1 [Araneus ventricosus]|uniref:Uncharacterized protein n=1 Tax=Araneus ventricosus TaxID=182803 RepID=A0A4Y2FQR7_ARAVE|nr:hypothetical protein AVEN_219135-1 [Araneus ventricosus]